MKSMKKLVCSVSVAMSLLSLQAQEATGGKASGDLETQFKELPVEARQFTGPLVWMHGDESPEQLRGILQKAAEGGNGCFTAESRPHDDWLGPRWYQDLAVCLDEAKKLNMKMWIFDERWWPSQMVGGKVPLEYGSKYLQLAVTKVQGPKAVTLDGLGGKHFVAALAGRDINRRIDGDSLIDLQPNIKEGQLQWKVPSGTWRILHFTWRYAALKGKKRGMVTVDGASRDSVKWFLDYVYQPHYDHFKEDFGKTIKGYFYDEPKTVGDWGTELIPEFKRRGVDWKKAFVAWKSRLANPEEQVAAQFQYREIFAEVWGRTMYGGMTEWCRARGVRSIGHFMDHKMLYLNTKDCAGDMFKLQKYSDMGGIDLVVDQLNPGGRPHAAYQLPKLASSISHVYGKEKDVAMCEIFGGYKQKLSYPQMKWITDQHQVRGVNFMIPHAFNPRAPYDRDFPPYFYNGGFEPRWPLYRVWADYTSRLSVMLTGGRHVCPVALMYMGQSYHVGKSITPEDMTTALQDALFDCDWMPYDAFESDASIADKQLHLQKEHYKILVAPAAEVIPYPILAKIKAFYEAGGVVIGYGILPSKSGTPGKSSADIANLTNAIWGAAPTAGTSVCRTNAAGGRSYFLPAKPTAQQVQAVLTGDAGIRPTLEVLEGETNGWLHILHRVKEDRDIFLIANQHHDGPTKTFRLRAHATGVPECWDALRNETRSLPYKRVDKGQVEFNLTLEPMESVLVVFRSTERDIPTRLGAEAKPAQHINVVRQSVKVVNPLSTIKKDPPSILRDSSWVWHAADPEQAPLGKRYFRGTLELPKGRSVKEATMRLTADNNFILFVNGNKVGEGAGAMNEWRRAKNVTLKGLKSGKNLLAVEAINTGRFPNIAGLIGRFHVILDDGSEVVGSVDASWKSSATESSDWVSPNFDDTAWTGVKVQSRYGEAPRGNFDRKSIIMTLPSVKQSAPFAGTFKLPENWLEKGKRVYLETSEPPHDSSVAVKLNDQFAGGFIGKPFRLDITENLKTGENKILIEPFAPKTVRIVRY